MSEKQIEVNIITKDPDKEFYKALTKIINAETKSQLLAAVRIVRDAYEEQKLQNNSIVL